MKTNINNKRPRIIRKVVKHIQSKCLSTWIEIEASFITRNYTILDKNIVICQGSPEDPNLIYVNKNEIDYIIEALQIAKKEI